MRLARQNGRLVRNAPQDERAVCRLGFDMPGQLRNLRWERDPYVPPAEDELEVEVRATGLNFRDIMYALGLLSDEAIENGFAGPTLGLEFTGTVVRAGSGTTSFETGDRVVGFGSAGFSNRILTTPGAVSHIPPGISFEAAATIPSTFFTAYYALCHLGRLREGEKVLIHGAAGGVGLAAIQIAKWRGAEIFASAGSDEKRDFLRLLGVDHIFDSRSLSYADEIMSLTGGGGIDVVLNSLAGEAINRNFRVLKPFGRFLELGKRDFYENTKIGLRPFRNNITYFGIDADQLMCERPELTRQLFAEVMALFHDGILHPLPYRAFEAENVVDAFRYMQQSRQIGKIVVTYRNGIPIASGSRSELSRLPALPAAATYLVTGGLSGFGLKTAQWLAARGARHLVLLSRSGVQSEEAAAAVAEIERSGVRVLAASCDVTDREQVAGLLKEAAHRFPPLKGIVHAAAVIDDGLIRNLEASQMHRVLAPKILGARHLHELTQGEHLDFFVLFSSATTLFGNPGQGNYVAANTWLEALARYRRSRGLPATCVLFGAIKDAGFLARNEKTLEALQKRMGGAALDSAEALDEMGRMLVEEASNEGVLDLHWKALSRFLPGAGAPKFSEFARQAGATEADEDNDTDIQNMLATLSDGELATAFSDILRQELGEILRVSPDKIDPSKSVYDMGLDSLMGVELVIALESRFGIRLPVMALSESPTITKLADRIIAQLRGHEGVEPSGHDAGIAAKIKLVAAQHAEEVSAVEIAQFTEQIRSQEAVLPNQGERR
jgi:NADPH:quinone reductase-like Zn-dependent oxidoreductase/acyl carrier protein